MTIPPRIAASVGALLILAAISLRADQLQMQNGDRYTGKILSMSSNSVVLESDTLGQVTLPRNKISVVMFGSAAATNAAAVIPVVTGPSPTAAATNTDLSAALHNLGA